ncbi:MAG: TetR/AcrR family transcriptional regulator [Rubrobacteraceae bacterium]
MSPEDSQNEAQAGGEQRLTRERILDAAQELFAGRGFDATSTQSISDEAGVPSGLIFYYFKTKPGLLEALIQERSFMPEARRLMAEASIEDPRSTLVDFGVKFLETVRRRRSIVGILMSECLTNETAATYFRELRAEARTLVEDYLEEGIQAGHLRPLNVTAFSRSFLYSLVLTAVFEEPETPIAFAEEVVDFLLEGRIPNS